MGSVFDSGDQTHLVFVYLTLIFALLAAICSGIVIFLIRRMGLKNGHALLIETMSWFQLLYDITIFPSSVRLGNDPLYDVSSAFQIIGGLGSAFTSNFIAFTAFYVVKYIRSVNVYHYYPHILAFILTVSMICVILYIMSCHQPYGQSYQNISELYLYFYFRVFSIVLNFAFCIVTATRIHYTTVPLMSETKSLMDQAISTLSMRLIYYPIVQAVSRSSISWYEGQYGFNFDPANATRSQFIGQCFFAILTPSASFGYLLIFLLMQPNAWECLKCAILCRPYEPRKLLTAEEVRNAQLAAQNALANQQASSNPNVIQISNPIRRNMDERPSGSIMSSNGSLVSANFCMSDVDDDELWLLVGRENAMNRRNSDESL